MRVLLWTEGFFPHIGGVAVISAHFVKEMLSRGHEFAIVTSLHDPQLPVRDQFLGIPVYRFPFSQALWHRDLREIKLIRTAIVELKHSFQPEIIHVNECGPSNFFHPLTETRVPRILTLQSILPQSAAVNGLLVNTLRTMDWVAAVSQAMLDDARALVPAITPRSSLVYDGAPMPVHVPSPLSDDKFDAPIIFCAGRVVRDKGFDVMLDAFPRVLQFFPRARLVIAGDGEARAGLEQRTVEMGLTHAVEFPGWIQPEQIPAAMDAATIVVMPSRWREPFGMIALEGMQMARPVIASRTGGLAEIVVDGETGMLFENENTTALAEAVTFLLAHRDAARRMGLAGRKRAQKFSIRAFADAYASLYRRLNFR